MVDAFTMLLGIAEADTLNDPDVSDVGRMYVINGYRLDRKRLGRVLRSVKAMDA